MKKRVLLAVGMAVLIGAGVFASAATLGGITSDNLGASDQVVASCDTDGVEVAYTTRTASNAVSSDVTANTTGVHWAVDTVAVSGINTGCEDQEMKIVLVDAAGDELYAPDGQLLDDSGEETFSLASASVPAENVYHIAVVVSGVDING
jgi:hypothetical protein